MTCDRCGDTRRVDPTTRLCRWETGCEHRARRAELEAERIVRVLAGQVEATFDAVVTPRWMQDTVEEMAALPPDDFRRLYLHRW